MSLDQLSVFICQIPPNPDNSSLDFYRALGSSSTKNMNMGRGSISSCINRYLILWNLETRLGAERM